MADKPKVNLSIAALEAEIGVVDPYVIALPNSKLITFPDVAGMEAEEAEAFLEDIQKSKRNSEALKKWLPADDYENLRAARLSLRTQSHMMGRVGDYYTSTLGTKGEDSASAN
jgi:hypothetical protein